MGTRKLPVSLRGLDQASVTSRFVCHFLKSRQSAAQRRSMATDTRAPVSEMSADTAIPTNTDKVSAIQSHVLTTIYSFPEMRPLRFENYPSNHLHLPLRRDLLHRAVIYEGDMTRQGTANTKGRSEVRGSRHKLRPQKGTGQARLGDKKSPMLRGGGVAFGPKPRDFSTDLPRKMYDLAWRTALSYRYRRGELIIAEDGMDIKYAEPWYIKQVLDANRWGKPDGRSLLITRDRKRKLFRALDFEGAEGRVQQASDVDVKDLLELGRVVIEKGALDRILLAHQADLIRDVARAVYRDA